VASAKKIRRIHYPTPSTQQCRLVGVGAHSDKVTARSFCCSGMEQCQFMSVCWQQLDPESLLQHLTTLPDVRQLYFDRCSIDDSMALTLSSELSRALFIQDLSLSCNPIGDAGISAITRSCLGLDRLKRLGLAKTSCGDAACREIASLLSSKTVLLEQL
jgi:hypothetical protein